MSSRSGSLSGNMSTSGAADEGSRVRRGWAGRKRGGSYDSAFPEKNSPPPGRVLSARIPRRNKARFRECVCCVETQNTAKDYLGNK